MAQRIVDNIYGVASSTGAVTANVATSASIPSGSSFSISGQLVGRDTTSGDTVVFTKIGRGKNIAGTVSFVGAIVDLVVGAADVALSSASATMVVSGTTIIIQPTGVVAKTIEWTANFVITIN